MIKCKQCGRENDDSFTYCLDCGTELKPGVQEKPEVAQPVAGATRPQPEVAVPAAKSSACPKCNAAVPADSLFCSSCGHRLGEETAKGRTVFMHQAAPDAVTKPRARLILIKPDGSEGTVFSLASEKTTIGRTQGTIMFSKDAYVSPRHAELEFKQGKLTVTDLNSLNGVYRRMTEEVQIYPGTYFRIGRQLLRLEMPGEFQKIDLEVSGDDDSKFWGSPAPQPWARLVQVLDGGKIGEIYLLALPEVTIGREEGEVRFPHDAFISARHTILINKEGDCFLRDLGSSNGTYLKIRESQALNDQDRLQIGNQVLKVDLS